MASKKPGFAQMGKRRLKKIASEAGSKSHPNKGFGSLSKKERKENASKAAKARWAKVRAERKAKEEEYAQDSRVE